MGGPQVEVDPAEVGFDKARLASGDWLRRTRRDVGGAGGRQWLIAASLVAGALLGLAMLGRVGPWLATAHVGH